MPLSEARVRGRVDDVDVPRGHGVSKRLIDDSGVVRGPLVARQGTRSDDSDAGAAIVTRRYDRSPARDRSPRPGPSRHAGARGSPDTGRDHGRDATAAADSRSAAGKWSPPASEGELLAQALDAAPQTLPPASALLVAERLQQLQNLQKQAGQAPVRRQGQAVGQGQASPAPTSRPSSRQSMSTGSAGAEPTVPALDATLLQFGTAGSLGLASRVSLVGVSNPKDLLKKTVSLLQTENDILRMSVITGVIGSRSPGEWGAYKQRLESILANRGNETASSSQQQQQQQQQVPQRQQAQQRRPPSTSSRSGTPVVRSLLFAVPVLLSCGDGYPSHIVQC